MKKIVYLYVFAVVLLGLTSCEEKPKSYKLIKVTEHSSTKMVDSTLIHVLNREDNLNLSIDYTLSEDFALQKLENKEVDFLIIPNNATTPNLHVKGIVPLLPRFLIIMSNKKTDYTHVKDLFEQGEVYLEDMSRLDSVFFNKMFYSFGIDENKVNAHHINELIIDTPNENDSLKVYVGLTHLKNIIVSRLVQQGWNFYSLDDVNNFGKGSRVEGFSLLELSIEPFIMPRSIFHGKPVLPILTISIKDILVTRDDMPRELIHDLTQTLVENRPELIRRDPAYNLLNFNFNPQQISFPLHRGTYDYLNRDKPPVWLEYVKMAWPVISISVVFFGFLASFRQALKKRKKQQIDMYYRSLLTFKDKADSAESIQEINKMLKEARKLRSRAIKSLAEKKLDPGESFNIFLALYNEVKTDLIEHLKEAKQLEDTKATDDKKA